MRLRPSIEQIHGPMPARMHRDLRRRLAVCLRRAGRFPDARHEVEELLRGELDPDERARLLGDRALIAMGVQAIEDLALPGPDGREAFLEAIAALDPEVVVPGHGPLATTVDVLAQRDYLAWVLEEARAHHAAGHSPLEAARAMDLGPFADWNEPERLAFNVHRAYREIQGGAWDEVVDLGAVLADVAALAAHLAGRATT